jgi:hypothetical protein
VNLAASPAAGYAVSALGLAALAVSAMSSREPALELVPVNAEAPWRANIRELTVVGSPAQAEVAWAIAPLARAFADCATSAARVTIYAHFSGGTISALDAYGTDTGANQCALHTIDKLTIPVLDEMDVMIPIDFEPAM